MSFQRVKFAPLLFNPYLPTSALSLSTANERCSRQTHFSILFLTRSTSSTRLLIGCFDFLWLTPRIALIQANLHISEQFLSTVQELPLIRLLCTTVLCYKSYEILMIQT